MYAILTKEFKIVFLRVKFKSRKGRGSMVNKSAITSQWPELVKDEVLDERASKYGKTVINRHFRMPNGSIHEILCVSTSSLVPVIIFPVTRKGTVLFVNQYRFGTNESSIELPGGISKKGESIIDTAYAELSEEVGAVAESFEIIGSPMAINPALHDAKIIAVLATGCCITRAKDLDETEALSVMEFSISECRRMIRGGEVSDSKTVAISYIALDHLGLL